jgi:hypothetical protein
VLLQVGQHAVLQHRGDGVAVLIADGRPVGARCSNWAPQRGRKKCRSPGGPRKGPWRLAVQVQAEVFGQLVVFKNVLQQTFVARAQHHHVVRHIGVLAVGAKVPNKQTRRIVALGNALVGPMAYGAEARSGVGRSRPRRRC